MEMEYAGYETVQFSLKGFIFVCVVQFIYKFTNVNKDFLLF